MAWRACMSSRPKAVRGASSEAGSIATVDKLLAGLATASRLPLEDAILRTGPVYIEGSII